MLSRVLYPSVKHNAVYPFSQEGTLKPQSSELAGVPPVTAHSVEFVAKPEEAQCVGTAIPAAIAGALKDVTGFAGCLVMISDQEARLVTVVTLWRGADRVQRCSQNVRWVKALLAPYLDRYLRMQTMVARLPVVPMIRLENSDGRECSVSPDLASEDETVCVV